MLSYISKFQNCLSSFALSLAKRCLTGVSAPREGSRLTLSHFTGAQGLERATRWTESPRLNETERGQRRVNLLPLEEGPFGEGEENNLYEEQRRQRAIPEKKSLCRARRTICPRFSQWGHFLDLRVFTLLWSYRLGEGGGGTFMLSAAILKLDSIWDERLWEAEGEAKATRTPQ